jgi:hypothetical protein
MGARLTAELYRQNKISRKEALFLYGFVNNLSPVFILSYLSTDQLQLPRLGTAFLCTILGSAFLWGLISSIRFRREVPIPDDISQKSEDTALQPGDISQAFATIDATINDAILNIVRLGAYITVFSIISHALSTLADSSHPLLLVLVSCIEITNGIHLIAVSSLPLYIRYILLCSISAFGGFSALMQTISVAGMDRETIIAYIKSRVMITLLSTLLSIATVLFVFFLRLR